MLRHALLLALVAPIAALKKVLVTGAGGRTGKLVFKKLKDDYADVAPLGLARSAKAAKALKAAGAAGDEVVAADVADEAALAEAMAGCDAVVLCTSAVPAIRKRSLVKLMVKLLRRPDVGRPEFSFPPGGTPEEVDWLGARKQIDAAKAAGVSHFVFVSSMGGTQPENFLNTIGKQDDGSGGDILLWKRKAERYLVDSGVPFTIVHPGGLVDEEPGKRELTVEVDDVLLGLKSRSVARASLFFAGLVAYALSEQISPHHYGPIGAASGVAFFFLRLWCVRSYREHVAERRRQRRPAGDDDGDQVLEPIVAAKGGAAPSDVV
ncbi:divinyl chlorophyllide a 8-vinyl-reductase [Aureococcus anophagefferens]|nr:divinyl chlorophyllide a 8-vinyl-reductase [Aureococcus anophagefferens]